MGKINFLSIFILTIIVFSLPRTVSAFTCSLRTSPDPIVIPSGRQTLPDGMRIQYNFTVDDPGTYHVFLRRGGVGPAGDMSFRDLRPNTENILVNSSNQPPDIVVSAGNREILQLGSHEIEIEQQGVRGNNICRVNYTILREEESQQISCNILGPARPNPGTDIILSGTILPAGRYRFWIPAHNIGSQLFESDASGSFPQQNLGRLGSGTYQIILQKQIIRLTPGSNVPFPQLENTNCNISPVRVEPTTVNPSPNTSPIPIGSSTPTGPTSPTGGISAGFTGPTTSAAGISCGTNSIETAIGCIPTEPSALVNTLLRFVVGIAGGGAFLLMLFGAFQMIASAGNPDTLKTGQDRFTSAIIGLLFVIFSVLLLQIIGVDILRLPGFS